MNSFFELFGDVPLRTLFADWRPKPLAEEDGAWLNFPPADFRRWAREFPRHSFDGIPSAPNQKNNPSFLLSQTHRVWLSSSLVARQADPAGTLVDFGSYPFVVPLALRRYFNYGGPIVATAIQPLPAEAIAILKNYSIDIELLDLDPHVADGTGQGPPRRLARPDESVDTVTMFHVIEHLYHPMDALREAFRLLKKGGRLIIATDNAMMLGTLQNYVSDYGYVFEPVSSTAAMTFNDWRGHVRFFTAADLTTMLGAAGFAVAEHGFEEVFYDVFHDDYFVDAKPRMQGWRKKILQSHRQFGNDLFIVGIKGSPSDVRSATTRSEPPGLTRGIMSSKPFRMLARLQKLSLAKSKGPSR